MWSTIPYIDLMLTFNWLCNKWISKLALESLEQQSMQNQLHLFVLFQSNETGNMCVYFDARRSNYCDELSSDNDKVAIAINWCSFFFCFCLFYFCCSNATLIIADNELSVIWFTFNSRAKHFFLFPLFLGSSIVYYDKIVHASIKSIASQQWDER